MKRILIMILTLCVFVFALSACGPNRTEGTIPSPPEQSETPSGSKPAEPSSPTDPEMSEAKKAYTIREDGRTVYFGSYPTIEVKDEKVVSALSNLAGSPSDSEKWTSYGYYSGGKVQDYMLYADVEYDSVKYRGVFFSSYRPNDTRSEGSEERSYQDDNGYAVNKTYWFEYETLTWRILEKTNDSALIVSERVLDSHEFYPAAKGERGHKANDYQSSSNREFLNNSFYHTAFSEAEQTNIIENAAFGAEDLVFPLSYEEVTNNDYGYYSDQDRKLETTDYAKAQGLNTNGGARWWLRSSNDTYDFYARYVDGSGYPEYNQYVYWSSIGIVPALNIKLFDDKETSSQKVESKILIAYFSCTNTTKGVAEHIEAKTGGTLYEIVPKVPYTADDLAYYTGGRADREQADATARPAISGSVEGMEKYQIVFLGYPIWHGQAPKIVYTFLESYDFSGKTIVPFCTSHSSGIGTSATNMHSLAESADWLDGKRFSSGVSQNTVDEWIDSLNLMSGEKGEDMTEAIYLTINDSKITVKLEKNSAVDALIEILKKADITYTANDYGGFEKVGSLGFSLPRSDKQMTTEAGDVVLYSGNQIVLFYGSNSWSYTKLGKVQGVSSQEWKNILTQSNNITVRISLR